jgi:hypothetical protein
MIEAIQGKSYIEPQPVADDATAANLPILPEPATDGLGCGSIVDLAEALARLVAQSAAEQRNADRAERQLLRQKQYQREDAQVAALRDKASHIQQGAVTSGMCSIASGATGVSSALCGGGSSVGSNEATSTTGSCLGQMSLGLGKLSQPLGQLVGDSRAAEAEADAKAAELASQRAKDQALDAADHAQQMASLAQEAMQAMRSLESTHNDGVQAIVRRM